MHMQCLIVASQSMYFLTQHLVHIRRIEAHWNRVLFCFTKRYFNTLKYSKLRRNDRRTILTNWLNSHILNQLNC